MQATRLQWLRIVIERILNLQVLQNDQEYLEEVDEEVYVAEENELEKK